MVDAVFWVCEECGIASIPRVFSGEPSYKTTCYICFLGGDTRYETDRGMEVKEADTVESQRAGRTQIIR